MNILITGIHGFVGTNLVSAYKSQHSIYGLDIISPQKEGIETSYSWDELEKLPHIDIIIHLAGKAHDTKTQINTEDYLKINTGLTIKIYDWFLKSNSQKFVFFSSVKAATDTVVGEILTEDVEPSPKGPYGESKLAAEKYILENLPKEKQVYILRPCMIHGPGNKGNLNLLYNIVSKGIPWPLGAFENMRSFCSIDNLTMIIKELINRNDIQSGIYNICDDEALSTSDIIRLIAQSKNLKARIWKMPKALIKTIANVGDVLQLPLNTERLKKLTENYLVSNEKIKKAIGKSFPVTASEGLIKTLKSFDTND